jgi:hypothetical protein
MHPLVILGTVAFFSFSLGIIAGCLIMSKEDTIPEMKKTEENKLSTNEIVGK